MLKLLLTLVEISIVNKQIESISVSPLGNVCVDSFWVNELDIINIVNQLW